MKSVIAIVFALALAMGVQSSIIPWGGIHSEVAGHGLAYTAVSGPAILSAPAAVAVHTAPAAVALHAPVHAVHAAAHPAAISLHGGPVASHWDSPLVHGHHAAAVVVAPAHEGTYLAKTRGAVHAAPLAGHLNSAASINVAPAPGTI